MAWYKEDIKGDGFIIWSRVRIYRNIEGMEFCSLRSEKAASVIIHKTQRLLEENGFHNSDGGTAESYLKYAEMGYADKGFIESLGNKALYMNEPCNLAVAVGGDDFICISSLLPSFSMEETYMSAAEVEVLIDSEMDFAYSESIGYVSPLPSHTGHGVTLSACIYLPAMSGLCEIKKVIKKANLQGYVIHPMTTYEGNACGLYIIECTPDIYTDIKVAISKLSDFLGYVISLEKEYERNVFGDNIAVLNKAWRSVGIMEYSSSLCEEEMLSLISNIRLTHCLGCSGGLPYPIDIASLNTMQTELMNTYIYSSLETSDIKKDVCDKQRAKRFNEYIKALRMREVI